VDEVRAAISAAVHAPVMTAVFESIWGHVGQAAGENLGQTSVGEAESCCLPHGAVEREARLYWDCIGPGTQNQLLEFFRQKQFEDLNYRRCTEAVKKVCRAFFDSTHEATGVRPLSMALGYIPSCTQDYRAMTVEQALAAHQRSGLPAEISLLQPCVQNRALSKYQGLFQAGEEYDALRLWFFQNHQYNVHQQRGQPMKGNIEHLAQHCEGEGAKTTCECLRACLRAVKDRYECFGEGERPDFFSLQRSWEYYREAVVHEDYWLSCEEAALIALLARRNVDIYKFNGRGFEHVVSACASDGETDVVSIALEPGPQGLGGVRGHFSRIWPEASWGEHAVMVAAARARRQQELDELRLREHDQEGDHNRSRGQDDEQGAMSRTSSCTSFSTQVSCAPQLSIH